MFFLFGILISFAAISFADNTARMLSFEGFFSIYGASDLSSPNSTTSQVENTYQIEKSYFTALQSVLDKVLDFVPWKVIITSYNSTQNRDHDNDDYASGELHFRVEAFLSPEDNVAQYFSGIVDTLNYILVDELLSSIPLDAFRGARIPAGSLTIEEGINVAGGHTIRPSSSPITAPEKLHLLMLGDWGKGGINGDITATATSSMTFDKRRNLGKSGGTDYTYQAAVARSMMKYVRYINLRAVVLLGDNFYSSGVTSTTDNLWNTIWRGVYLTEGSPLNVPWYAVLGNHDYGSASNAEAQINRYQRPDTDDSNWIMPSHNYTQKFNIIGGGSVEIIFIDTTTLAPSVNKCCNEKGGVSLAQQALLINNQLQYIEHQLQEAALDPPTWLVVAGHYPVFSAGEHGDTSELKTYLLPLLEKYEVDAYFCGHDHISEHLEKGGVQYFVAGAGALTDKIGTKSSEGNLVWAGAGFSAFAAIAATEESLTVNFVNIYGETVYAHTMLKIGEQLQDVETVDVEISNTAWLLDTLGVENTSQAAVKLSGITILCIIISVTVILVLDANFVARIKRDEASLIAIEAAASDNSVAGDANDTIDEEKYNTEPEDVHSDTESTKERRGFLTSSIFGEAALNAYRQLNLSSLVAVTEKLSNSGSPDTRHEAEEMIQEEDVMKSGPGSGSGSLMNTCDFFDRSPGPIFDKVDSKIFRV